MHRSDVAGARQDIHSQNRTACTSDWQTDGWRQGLTHTVNAHAAKTGKDMLDKVAAEAEALRPGTVVAREGMVLSP